MAGPAPPSAALGALRALCVESGPPAFTWPTGKVYG